MPLKTSIRVFKTIAIILVIFQIYGSLATINNNKPGYPSHNDLFTFWIEYFLPLIISTILFWTAYQFSKKLQRDK